MIIRLLHVFLFYLLTGSLNAQGLKLNFNHLGPVDGLSQSINAFILQDSKGFVWISSMDGLNRFDGINIKTYRPQSDDPQGMKGKNIQSNFFESHNGDIWFCTAEAINCYRRATDKVEHFSVDSLLSDDLSLEYYVFHLDANNNLWVKVNDDLILFNIDLLQAKQVGPIDGIRCKVVEKESSTEIYSYFKGGASGIKQWSYDPIAGTSLVKELFSVETARFPALKIHDLWMASNDQIYLACNQGLALFSPADSKVNLFDSFEGSEVRRLWSIIRLNDRQIIVSSNNGILLFDLQRKAFIQRIVHQKDTPTSIASNNVRELYLDNDYNLWASLWTIGVDFANLYKTKFDKFKLYNTRKPLEGVLFDPGELAEDEQKRIWCASNQHGLMVLDSNLQVLPQIGFTEPGLKQVFKDKKGRIWLVPWEEYLYCVETENDYFHKIPIPDARTNNLGKLVQLSDDRLLYTKNEEKGVYEILANGAHFSVETLRDSFFSAHYFNKAFFSSKDYLYLSHRTGGLSVVDYAEGRFKYRQTIPIDGEVFSFQEMNDGRLFIGGSFGFAAVDQDKLQLIDVGKKDDFFISYVYGVLSGKNNLLWLSTNQGLISYDLERDSFQFYTPMDGLQNYEFNENSALLTSKNEFWFGGINGYNICNLETIRKIPFPPKINLVKIFVNDLLLETEQNLSNIDSLKLPFWKNTLSFQFVASEYSHPENNQLKYRLEYGDGEKYDDDWVEAANRAGFARYAQLPSGEFRFIIKAANSDKSWSKDEKVIYFQIATPFWETPIFLASMSVLLLLAAWLGVKRYIAHQLRLKNLKIREQRLHIEKEEALQKERDRLAEDMHDELGSKLTNIRILTQRIRQNALSLKSIADFEKIDRHSIQLIQDMRFMVWAMQRENENLNNFLIYIRKNVADLLNDRQIQCSINLSKPIPDKVISGFQRKHIWLSIKESIHNIIKHSQADQVQLTFQFEKNLKIEIQDNGVGIPPLGSKPFGYGLKNMQNRMEKVNGRLKIESTNGTTIKLEIPMDDNILPHS